MGFSSSSVAGRAKWLLAALTLICAPLHNLNAQVAPEQGTKPGQVWCLADFEEPVLALAFSPDGRRLLGGGGEQIVYEWEVSTGKEIRRFKGHTGIVTSLVCAPDGKRLFTGGWDGTIRVWNLDTGKEWRRFGADHEAVRSVALSADGQKILSGGQDTTLRMWDIDSGKEVRRFSGHRGSVLSVAYFLDGLHIVSADAESIRIWDVKSGKERGYFGHSLRHFGSSYTSVATSPDGRFILSSRSGPDHDPHVESWDTQRGGRHFSWGTPKAETRIAIGGIEPNRRYAGHTRDVHAVAVSGDGRRGLSGSGTLGWELFLFSFDNAYVRRDDSVRVWDLASCKELHQFRGHTDGVIQVAFSPDGRFAASSSADKTVRLWRMPK